MSTSAELILIPTEAERRMCPELIRRLSVAEQVSVRLCGWGLVQSAIGSTRLLMEIRPRRVWLVGIAGALHSEDSAGQRAALPAGRAYEFSHVAVHGIGVGQGTNHLSFEQLGWAKSFGGPDCPGSVLAVNPHSPEARTLLSVTSASSNFAEAAQKLIACPQAMAEDMESYSVAAACKLLEVPLRVIRGISNRAGDRDFSSWLAPQAMRSAVQLTMELMSRELGTKLEV